MSSEEITTLLVDDDDIDRMSIERGFRKANIDYPVVTASDGVEALHLLRGTGGSDRIEGPFIILLDLNMPRMGGLEFLKTLRADEELRNTIVFVLTTSDSAKDRQAAYEANIAGYCLKTSAGGDFKKLVQMLAKYWGIVELP